MHVRPPARGALAAVLATAALAAGAVAANSPANARPTPKPVVSAEVTAEPELLLNQRGQGRDVVDELGSRLDKVAKVNKMSPRQLEQVLEDPAAWLGRDGRIFFMEEAPAEPVTSEAVAAAPFPLDQTFLLHSLPGSAHTIYLDFDGYTLDPGKYWSSPAGPQGGGMTAGTFDGWSLDGSAAFSDAEKEWIQMAWQLIAAKYAPFDVDVTTQDPGAEAYNRNGSGDQTYGDHVVFTGDPDAVNQACGGTCAGVAPFDTFDEPNDNIDYLEPAWVFTDNNFDNYATSAVSAAHEIGHTLGLLHDGTQAPATPSEYYYGHDNWSPIMGGSGIRAVVQWSKGEYYGASRTEDDIAIIAGNGAPLRGDNNYGGTTGTAAVLPAQTSYTIDSVITSATDKDMFKVTRSCVGDLEAVATGPGEGQTLDIKLRILNSSGTPLVLDDPAAADPPSGQTDPPPSPRLPTGMSATASKDGAAAGDYYIEVDGVGRGAPTSSTPTGYTDYGSVGAYHLTITGCAAGGGTVPDPPTGVNATQNTKSTTGTLTWTPPADDGGSAITGYRISGLPSGATVDVAPSTSYPLTGLVPGQVYNIGVAALNLNGASSLVTDSLDVQTWAPTTAPVVTVLTGTTTAIVEWTAPANPGGATVNGWRFQLLDGTNTQLLLQDFPDPALDTIQINDLVPGNYTVKITQLVTSDSGSTSPAGTKIFTIAGTPPPTVPSAPIMAKAVSGTAGGIATATVYWKQPASTGGSAITGYRVVASKLNSLNGVTKTIISSVRPSTARSYKWTLPAGRYKFRVIAYNGVGKSPYSAYSNNVYAR